MQDELKEKWGRLARMNTKPVGSNYSLEAKNALQAVLENREREEEDAKKERKVIKMVTINGFFNFILRAPDILFWMENSNSLWILVYNYQSRHNTPGLISLIRTFAISLTF
jgi:hypothetical protein